MSDEYAEGGYLTPPGPTWTRIHPDECLVRLDGHCARGDHPTPTSDCTTVDWIKPPVKESE